MKTKVAFFADCLIRDYDGAIRTMYQIIDRIDSNHFEFLFITGDGPKEDIGHPCIDVPSIPLPINNGYKISLSFLSNQRLQSVLEAFAPDIIHLATPSPLGHYGLRYARSHNIPVISIYHTHFISYAEYYFEKLPQMISVSRQYLMTVMQSFYNQCDLVYVPTDQIRNELRQMGVFSNHLKIWKRGVDTNMFSMEKIDIHFIESLTKNKYKNLLFASRLVWEKNLKTLVKIYNQIQKENLPYNLLIVGEGYARDQLEQEMPKSIFLGHTDHSTLSKIYASSDVFVFPSVSETFGNVVAEAMASGLPCVIANGGGTVEFIEQGVNGFLCRPYDEHDYVQRIDDVLSNDTLKTQFIQKGIKQTSTLSWDTLVKKYFEDIQFLAQRQNRLIA